MLRSILITITHRVEIVIMTYLLEHMADAESHFIPLELCHDGVIIASDVPVTNSVLSELDNKFRNILEDKIGLYMPIEMNRTEDMFSFVTHSAMESGPHKAHKGFL